jgi:hypothetical protein
MQTKRHRAKAYIELDFSIRKCAIDSQRRSRSCFELVGDLRRPGMLNRLSRQCLGKKNEISFRNGELNLGMP